MTSQFNNSAVRSLSTSKRRRLQMTGEGWAAVALTGWVLASAWITHVSLTLLVFCMLVAVLTVGWAQTLRNLRGLEVQRHLPEQAVAGRPFLLDLEVRNRRRLGTSQSIILSSRVEPPATVMPSLFLPSVPPRGHSRERVALTLPRRGLYRLAELELTSRFPFGFMERSVVLGEAQQLIVYPRLGKLHRRFFEAEREVHPHEEGRRPGAASMEVDYHGLRDFRDGDSPRWIHWTTTARRGRLMVKEFEARHNRDVALLVDPWLPRWTDDAADSMLELAISFAATLCVELCERHSLHIVLGIATDPPVVRHGQSSPRLLRELLEQLALVHGTPDTQWEKLLQELPVTWSGQVRITTISPRRLDLASHAGPVGVGPSRRWQRLSRRLMEVDVSSSSLRDYFELQ
jgi:uncharacterized protein (DUF58 family)